MTADDARGGRGPTKAQREILMVLVQGGRIGWYEGESSPCLISADGDFEGRLYGGMRHRLVRDGWLKRYRLTPKALAAIGATGEGTEGKGDG